MLWLTYPPNLKSLPSAVTEIWKTLKCTKRGWFGVVRDNPRSSAMSPFDRAHTISYSFLIETMRLSCTDARPLHIPREHSSRGKNGPIFNILATRLGSNFVTNRHWIFCHITVNLSLHSYLASLSDVIPETSQRYSAKLTAVVNFCRIRANVLGL